MMTIGSKIYFKVAGAVWALAVVYGYVTQTVSVGIWKGLSGDGVISSVLGPLTFGYKGGVGDHFGYGLLMGVAGVAAGLGAAHIAFRDGSPELAAAMDGDAPSTTRPSINASMWPFLGAIAVGLLLLGLANSPLLFLIGVVALTVVAFEWTLLAFSEQVSGDPAVNALARRRVGSPVELPVGLAIGALSIVFCISRLLVASSKLGASIIATAIGAVVVAAAFYLSSKPKISRSTMVVAVTLLSVGVLAAGIGGAIAGPAELPHEESTSAEHGAMGAPGQSDVTAISSMAIG